MRAVGQHRLGLVVAGVGAVRLVLLSPKIVLLDLRLAFYHQVSTFTFTLVVARALPGAVAGRRGSGANGCL